MFGLNSNQKNKKNEFIFELEEELNNVRKHKEIKNKVEKRIDEVKNVLRDGQNKKEFDRFGLILHGYTSLLKVMSRFNPK